jgi:hypothetical protein
LAEKHGCPCFFFANVRSQIDSGWSRIAKDFSRFFEKPKHGNHSERGIDGDVGYYGEGITRFRQRLAENISFAKANGIDLEKLGDRSAWEFYFLKEEYFQALEKAKRNGKK